MNFADIPLEHLETIYTALGEYLAARRQHEAAGRIRELETKRRQVALELDEARAQLSAHTEMVERLIASLKLNAPAANGHNGAGPAPATKKAGRKQAKQAVKEEEEVSSPPELGDEPVVDKPYGWDW